MAEQTFSVEGLRCEGCVQTVAEALRGLAAVTAVDVEVGEDGSASVLVDAATPVSVAEVQQALTAKGDFTVITT